MTSHRTTVFRCAQLLLIIAAFGFDFAHGILLGEHAIGFHPIYRLRQTLAVAISRLHDPPLHGYLAYQSMVDAFNRNGFASAPGDVGPRLGDAGWIEIFRDPARMDRALQDAVNTTVDTTLAPQLIHDNELGWADYVYLGFRLFGVHMSSLYYFYFLLLGLSSLLFIVAFHRSPFLMYLLLTYLAGIGFLENYVHSDGWQLGTLSNSRLYEALSLLPATHLFAAVWTRQAFRLSRLATIATQSILLAFLFDCRITALWQIAMILAAAFGFMLIDLWRRRPLRPRWARVSWNGVWIAGVAGAALAAHMTMIKVSADRRYATELEYHVVWHEVLAGLLGASGELQREYLGEDHGVDFRDKDADMAVYRDLQRRHDTSSPDVIVQNGRITGLDPWRNPREWERLQWAMTFRIILDHPVAVIAGVYVKFWDQIDKFTRNTAMSLANLRAAALMTALGALAWLVAAGGGPSARELGYGAAASAVVLAFASVPAVIQPSVLSVGTLLSFMIALAVGPLALVGFAVRYAIGGSAPQARDAAPEHAPSG